MADGNPVYGIDLGTTYSCIAYVDEHGKPVVVPNADNQLTTPSVLYFESDDNIVVGATAKEVAEMHPEQVVSTVKRVMGDEHWHIEFSGHSYTPQEISSHILRKIVEDAQANTGHEIKDVVITVPAYFGLNQKEATKQAGEIAGLNVLYVIPEPTAAAISYGMEQEDEQVILVYDLGGGTFDITVIEVKSGAITVICTGGDHQLGGKNWDESLASYFAQRLADETGADYDEITEDKETWQELLNSAEKCKKALSTRGNITEKVSYDGERAKVELSREKFEEITQSWFENTISLTEQLLETAKQKGYGKIDQLLLVGGSSYMPQVTEGLKARFDMDVRLFDPNQSVAKGAALFGYKCYLDEQIKINIAEQTGQSVEQVDIEKVSEEQLEQAHSEVAVSEGIALPGLKKMASAKITNVTSKSFGIVVVDEQENEKVKNLIIVDDVVPTTVTQQFYTHSDNQQGVELRCIESVERQMDNVFDYDPDQEIGVTELMFEKGLPKRSPIELTFALAPDGLLSIHAKDLTTHREIDASFNTQSILSQEELDLKKQHNLGISLSS